MVNKICFNILSKDLFTRFLNNECQIYLPKHKAKLEVVQALSSKSFIFCNLIFHSYTICINPVKQNFSHCINLQDWIIKILKIVQSTIFKWHFPWRSHHCFLNSLIISSAPLSESASRKYFHNIDSNVTQFKPNNLLWHYEAIEMHVYKISMGFEKLKIG